MTPIETLQKYGLKPDVPSIKKRLMEDGYMIMAAEMSIDGGKFETRDILVIAKVIKFSDLSLLCSLAEKGERYEKAVVSVRARLAKTYSIVCETEPQKAIASAVDAALEDVITEAEGE